jgi:hypothetical protein
MFDLSELPGLRHLQAQFVGWQNQNVEGKQGILCCRRRLAYRAYQE